MTQTKNLLALTAAVSTANAAFQGFNYGAAFTNGAVKQLADFEQEFETAQGLEGTDGAFNSARLYTMVQGGTPNDPISAIPAAISTRTTLLFGLWASAGDEAFAAELEALQKTIDQYCDQLDGLVAGISVGSEDLYRISPTGIANGEFAGANPDTLVGYIERTREVVEGSCLSDAPIGHVDTWTAYDNSSNSAVIEACDFIGMNAFAYFEDTQPNAIENGASLFETALGRTQAAAGGKEIWITETGWPVSGDDFGEAVASTENARTFWEEVGCPRFGNVNVFWYTLKDAAPDTPSPSFGVIGSEWTTEPLYDLTCDASTEPSSSSSSSSVESSTTTSEATEEPTEEPTTTVEATSEPTEEPTEEPTTTVEATSEPTPEPTTETTEEPEPEPTTESTSEEPIPEPTVSEEPEPEPTTDAETDVPSPPSSVPEETTIITVPTPTGGVTDTAPPQPEPTIPGEEPAPEPSNPAGTTDGGAAPTETPPSGSTKLNSLGAAVVAMVLAIGFF